MTAPDRPLGLRHHLRSAAAACEGRGRAARGKREERLLNALADLFYEAAEQDDHDNPLSRELIAVADILNELSDDEPKDGRQ